MGKIPRCITTLIYFSFRKRLWLHSWLLAYKPVECKLDDIRNEINTWFNILKREISQLSHLLDCYRNLYLSLTYCIYFSIIWWLKKTLSIKFLDDTKPNLVGTEPIISISINHNTHNIIHLNQGQSYRINIISCIEKW